MCVVLAGAAWTDFWSGKVRNWWLLFGAVLGIWCKGWNFLGAAVLVIVPAFCLWHLRMMGAGDGKTMAVIAGFLGFSRGIRAIWTGLCIGAVWSLCRFWHDRSLRARLSYLFAYFVQMMNQKKTTEYDDWSGKDGQNRHRIPLAVCLASGVYLYLFLESCLWPGI